MNRLNALVAQNETLQRLRDISCLLMLGDRQQEELVNYINGFINNFLFTAGSRYRDNMTTGALTENYAFSYTEAPMASPYIKKIWPCQGAITTMEIRDFMSPQNRFVQYEPTYRILPFTDEFYTGKRGIVPDGAYWIGFLSDFVCEGAIQIDGIECYFHGRVKPTTVAKDDANVPPVFTKLTDTSPFVSGDGLVSLNLWDSSEFQTIVLGLMSQVKNDVVPLAATDDVQGFDFSMSHVKVSNTFKVSGVYVGLGLIFG